MTIQTPSLTGHIKGGVDCLLDVAARLLQDLPHFPCHVTSVILFALLKDLGAAVDDFAASRRGSKPPPLECIFCGIDSVVHVLVVGTGEDPHDIFCICGILVLEGLPGARLDPCPPNEVLVHFRGHLAGKSWKGMQNYLSYQTLFGEAFDSSSPFRTRRSAMETHEVMHGPR